MQTLDECAAEFQASIVDPLKEKGFSDLDYPQSSLQGVAYEVAWNLYYMIDPGKKLPRSNEDMPSFNHELDKEMQALELVTQEGTISELGLRIYQKLQDWYDLEDDCD